MPPVSRRAAIAFALPLVWLASIIGCPRGTTTTDAGPSAIASLASAQAAASSAPKTIDVPPSASASSEPPDAALDPDADLDATPGDASSDVSDADARSRDAADDAPLMGTKTFLDENPLKGIRKITSNAAKVHKAPKDGASITSLPKGTEVSLVAEIYDWYRVRYTDPSSGIRRQGWVYVINFAGPRQKTCPLGWTHHAQDGGWCDRECTKNTDCKALKGYKCSAALCFYAGD